MILVQSGDKGQRLQDEGKECFEIRDAENEKASGHEAEEHSRPFLALFETTSSNLTLLQSRDEGK